MQPGHLVLVCYGEVPPVWHVRLLLAAVQNTEWVILTPDYDRYIERLDHLNTDFTGFEYLGANGQPPAHVPVGQICGFQDMSPQFLAQQMQAGRVEANAERANRGLPPHAPPAQPQPPPAPVGAIPPNHQLCQACWVLLRRLQQRGSLASSSSWSDGGGELLGGCGRCWRATKG